MVKEFLKKAWYFIWHEDSWLSWIANLILAFLLVKFIIYPLIGALLGTGFPLVAVVSSSMEHNTGFDDWWNENKEFYEARNMTFNDYKFTNGFNKGDIMILKGVQPKDIKIGDVVVYENNFNKNPIIHRVIEIKQKEGKYYFMTKGDNNFGSDPLEVSEDQVKNTGKAVFRLPLLGWVKILFMNIIG